MKFFVFPIFFVSGQGGELNETNFNFELKLRNMYTIGQEDVQLKQGRRVDRRAADTQARRPRTPPWLISIYYASKMGTLNGQWFHT